MGIGETNATGLEIELTTLSRVYVLGESLPISVRYVNRTDASISLPDPAKTWEVQLVIENTENEEVALPFGRIGIYTDGDLEARTVEKAEILVLEPGAAHAFQEDITERWLDVLVPGENRLQVKDLSDDAAALASNRVHVQITFAKATISALLDRACALDASPETIAALDRWIAELRPSFQLSPSIAGGVAERQKVIQDTRNWWKRVRGDAAINSQISEINQRFAGSR